MKAASLGLFFLSAALLLLGLHPLGWAGCAWLAWIPMFLLFFSLQNNLKKLFFVFLIIGLAYYSAALFCLTRYSWSVFLITVLCCTPAFVVYFALLRAIFLKTDSAFIRALAAPTLWVAIHTLYALSPLSAVACEFPFYSPNPALGFAASVGFGLFSATVITLNFLLACLATRKNRLATAGVSAGMIVLVCFLYLLPGSPKAQPHIGLKVALIQHNLPMNGPWRLDHETEILQTYRGLALKATKKKPSLIVFPLYTLPGDPLRDPAFFSKLAREVQTHILLATHIPEIPGEDALDGTYLNVAILFAPNGKIVGTYQTTDAPFIHWGLEKTLSEYHVLDAPPLKLGILLCYEDIHPRIARKASKEGARILIALSNPGHFNGTSLPYYHLLQDRLRAIETGLPLLRVSANGYSAAINPQGKFIEKSELEKEEILFVEV